MRVAGGGRNCGRSLLVVCFIESKGVVSYFDVCYLFLRVRPSSFRPSFACASVIISFVQGSSRVAFSVVHSPLGAMAETAVAASSAPSALLVKPKAAFEAFIPDKRAEDGQTRRWTPSSGSEQEEIAVAATPRAKKISFASYPKLV